MAHSFTHAFRRVLPVFSLLGVVAVAAIGLSAIDSGQPALAQSSTAAAVAPPAVSVSKLPLELDPSKWVGCHRVDGGMLCAPSIQTGTPAIQERLRAQQAAAGGPTAGRAPAQPPAPMVCAPSPNAAAAAAGARAMPQGGRGPIRVLVIVRGHPYERELFDDFLDCLGDDITYSIVDHPAADLLMNPVAAKNFDVYLFYDLGGPGEVRTMPDGTHERFYPDPSPELKKGFEALTKAGKGLVFIHHASAAWPHVWPEYSEVVGGACDWYAPITVRGILDPHHGYYGGTKQHITVVDKSSPITQGLGDGFDVTDEAYACAWFEDSVHPLLRTDFAPPDPLVNLNPARKFSNLSAWYKASENSPVFYTQIGHDHTPWENPAYQLLIRNAIKWAASPEALAWAKANHTKIFK